MRGMELSKDYYFQYGVPMILEQYRDYEKRIAAGLVGEGSECFGFDDEISTDHDFGPSFCLWLTDLDYLKIGKQLIASYDGLPKEYKGYIRNTSSRGAGRVGVHRIGEFYKRFTGMEVEPHNLKEWIFIPEENLAAVTNGEVFRDDLGEFTKIRKALLNYYPEDIRIKKIGLRASAMAQSGQYNYSRCMRRGETVAARQSVDEFIRSSISMIYLLNKRYKPFYKWMHKGMEKFTILSGAKELIEELARLPINNEVWARKGPLFWENKLNIDDRIVVLIEMICNMVVIELQEQCLTDIEETFLENHKYSILSRINDDYIREL